ncbi:MAG: MBL fold metallo-hydrolase [candidate division Zixibacteria bacterium]|nr:MBL fold metallo-hydrolase [candidate division Zixibacteria bacterium]
MSKLVLLGTSAGKASDHRASSSYLLDLGDHGILMDVGDGATRHFLANGYAPEWVTDIIITHTHADHVCGLPYFIQQRYLSGTDTPLTIWCPQESLDRLRGSMAFGYLFPERMPYDTHYHDIKTTEPWSVHGIEFRARLTTHLKEAARAGQERGYGNLGQCYAISAKVGKTAFLYSADVGSIDDVMGIPEPIDWLLIESTHIALDRLWPWADERGIKKIIITHIADDFDTSGVAQAEKYTSAEVVLAEDNMSFDFP